MSKAPGHRKWPDHEVRETNVDDELSVVVGGEVVARSADVIRVDEDEHPPRYYFPRSDVDMDKLEQSLKTTECPFKGQARHFSVSAGDRTIEDAAWSYEDPYEEHEALRQRIAFYGDELTELEVQAA